MEETRVSGENHRPAASDWQTLSHNVVLSTPERDSNSQLPGDHDHDGAYEYDVEILYYRNKIFFSTVEYYTSERTICLVVGDILHSQFTSKSFI